MAVVRRLSPDEAHARVAAGARLVDVRSEAEQAAGMAEHAEAIAQDRLLEDAAAYLPRDGAIVLICQRGVRSLNVAESMRQQGFADIASVDGGSEAWQRAGLPMSAPTLDADFLDRYSRQLRLPQVGIYGQRKLQQARIVMIGAGGLGAPAAFYLAAAGIGQLRLIDDDIVERSNLQRQILHVDAGVGSAAKVDSARERLLALNPRIDVELVKARVDTSNADALIADADVVIDGADNFPVRHALNDACIRLYKPLVYGAVERFDGQASVFDAGRQRGRVPCYRCLFPEAPSDAPNCAEAGVLGVVPGIIGLIQATEAIKLILGIGEPLIGRLLRFDALSMRFRETRLRVDPDCPACASPAG
ncbi:MAG: molybdopterin-synthase adenylyltransferase MoeB [Pseudomonadota bacterium]|nr:molybdopterin-synthase adenylyltransferase MoeB [Pseudomonadota bacterium]